MGNAQAANYVDCKMHRQPACCKLGFAVSPTLAGDHAPMVSIQSARQRTCNLWLAHACRQLSCNMGQGALALPSICPQSAHTLPSLCSNMDQGALPGTLALPHTMNAAARIGRCPFLQHSNTVFKPPPCPILPPPSSMPPCCPHRAIAPNSLALLSLCPHSFQTLPSLFPYAALMHSHTSCRRLGAAAPPAAPPATACWTAARAPTQLISTLTGQRGGLGSGSAAPPCRGARQAGWSESGTDRQPPRRR
eukprot:352431-Chlamydomonas_euryale.AAC.2